MVGGDSESDGTWRWFAVMEEIFFLHYFFADVDLFEIRETDELPSDRSLMLLFCQRYVFMLKNAFHN